MPKLQWKGSLRYLGRWKKSLWHGGIERSAVITYPDGLRREVFAVILPITSGVYFRYAPSKARFAYRVNYAHSFLKEHPIAGTAETLQAAKLRAGKALEQLTRDFT